MSDDKKLIEVQHLQQYFPAGGRGKKKKYVQAVDDVSFYIKKGETLGLVGESGCGKTTVGRTLLRLYEPTDGTIIYDGDVIFDKKKKIAVNMLPYRRKMQMVFQDPYASLDPRMTIGDIVGEAIDIHHLAANKKERRDKIISLLETVGLNSEHANRYPHEFSGGQRQRVALGRAIVREPKVFLLDEPLSNLDAKLRAQMRTEISKLHLRLGTTFIYVTHDQTEAMTMASRIVVMKDGFIQQCDTPQNLYDLPCNMFVAGFIGSPQMNFIDTKCKVEGDKFSLTFDNTTIVLPPAKAKKLADAGCNGKTVVMGIRPEDIGDSEIEIEAHQDCAFEADVTGYELLGSEVLLYFKVAGTSMTAKVDSRTTARMGDHIKLAIDPEKIHVFDKETELTITN